MGVRYLALNLDPVGLVEFEFRAADLCLQSAVIGQQKQSLGIVIQPSGRVDPGNFYIIGEGLSYQHRQ